MFSSDSFCSVLYSAALSIEYYAEVRQIVSQAGIGGATKPIETLEKHVTMSQWLSYDHCRGGTAHHLHVVRCHLTAETIIIGG